MYIPKLLDLRREKGASSGNVFFMTSTKAAFSYEHKRRKKLFELFYETTKDKKKQKTVNVNARYKHKIWQRLYNAYKLMS